jgi:hypothetical protein
MTGDAALLQAKAVIDDFNAALDSNDAEKLASCFYAEQAYWRDIVAFTSHIRTIDKPRVLATALLQMVSLRGLQGRIESTGSANFAVMSPVMVIAHNILLLALDWLLGESMKMFIDCGLTFRTKSPALDCMGKMVLLPVKADGNDATVSWKIWVLCTWVEQLVQYPENESLLQKPGRNLDDVDDLETDALIVGGGSS